MLWILLLRCLYCETLLLGLEKLEPGLALGLVGMLEWTLMAKGGTTGTAQERLVAWLAEMVPSLQQNPHTA